MTTRSISEPTRVVQIGFHLDVEGRSPAQLLRDWWALVDAAEMVARCGVQVSVIQACRETQHIVHQGVPFHFVAPDPGARTLAHSAAFCELLRLERPDVLHVQGVHFAEEVLALADVAPGIPILVQDHAGRPPRFWRRRLHRAGLARAAGIAFCALRQAEPFVRSGLIDRRTLLYEIPECSSRFFPGDRQQARLATGICGEPALLWVGHLNENKDPLTVLAAASAAARSLPQLRLWCCFGTGLLLGAVQKRIRRDPWLRGRVTLLGKVPHQRMELLMRAADIFVLGSHHEGSGCALIEAMACGLPPVVTDIPSFRALTGSGAVGMLWPCGEAERLLACLLRIAEYRSSAMRAAVRAHFDRHLSFRAVGSMLVAAYARMYSQRCVASPVAGAPASPVA